MTEPLEPYLRRRYTAPSSAARDLRPRSQPAELGGLLGAESSPRSPRLSRGSPPAETDWHSPLPPQNTAAMPDLDEPRVNGQRRTRKL